MVEFGAGKPGPGLALITSGGEHLSVQSKADTCPCRGVFRLAVLRNGPVEGSYNSALAIEPKWLPATIRTCPVASKYAVWRKRGVFKLPVVTELPRQGIVEFRTTHVTAVGRTVFSGREQDFSVAQRGRTVRRTLCACFR
jgi:hypothetical protein